MKGLTVFTDENRDRKILQIDINELTKNPNQFEDVIDNLIKEEIRKRKKLNPSASNKRLKK